MGALEWSRKAQAMLDAAAGGAEAQKYAAENEALKQRIADMEKQFAELSARVEPEKRGPGRPRKENAVNELTEAL
jgi:cell division protein FtsB